jgi:CBS domain-containing protein
MKNYSSHLLPLNSSLKDGLIGINQITDGILCLFIVDADNRLAGTLTDGDIRRALINGVLLADPIGKAMERNFQSISFENVTPGQIKNYRTDGIKLLPCLDEDGRIKKIYDLVAKESILPIDAVLMAGGKGERLRPLTDNTPKPLLKVGGKAIIDYNVDRLIMFGIEHINITVNYLAEQIEAHFADERDGVKIS